MTPDDELERELQSFRPRPASPELRRRVRGRLVTRRRWAAGAAVTAMAAGVVLLIVLGRPRPPSPGVVEQPSLAAEQPPAPTLLAYRQAAVRSPEALEHLLDRQAVRSAERGPAVRATTRFLTFRGSRE
jgi:hypothetical protein